MSRRRGRSAASLMALPGWIAAVAAALAGLYRIDDGAVPWPPLREPRRLVAWASVHTPAEMAFSLIRTAAIAMGWYLLVVALIALAARVSGASPLAWLAHRITLPSLRPLLLGGLGVSLAAGPLLAAAPAGASPPRPVPVMVLVADGDPPAPDGPRAEPPVMRVEPAAPPTAGPAPPTAGPAPPTAGPAPPTAAPAPPTAGPAPPEPPPPESPPPVPAPPPPGSPPPGSPRPGSAPPAPGTVVIQAGDNLWDVAARALTEQWHRHPSPAEVTPYWRSLIELNRGALRHESDPSLIFADQRFQLPPPPVPPTG